MKCKKRKTRWDFYGSSGCCLTCSLSEPGCMCSSVRCKACVFWFRNTVSDRGMCEIAELFRSGEWRELLSEEYDDWRSLFIYEGELDLEDVRDAVHEILVREKEVNGKVVKISELSNFVQAGVDVKTGDVITFKDAGVIRTAEETPFGREVFQISVELPNGDVKVLTVNRTSQRNLAKTLGDETEKWVGEQAVVTIVQQNVRGNLKDVIYLNPLQKRIAPKK